MSMDIYHVNAHVYTSDPILPPVAQSLKTRIATV